ncbi:MAG: response regulator [candidate division Zixibacteria bacterium]|nr:response regulator [candidate division Zixibacteria bacterium]
MRFGIDKKVNLLSVGVILFLGLILGYYFIRHETRALNTELDERATVLINSLATSCEYPILIRDREAISRLVKGVLTQKDVVFCRIEDMDGTVLYEGGIKDGKLIREFISPVFTKKTTEEGDEMILGVPMEVEEKIGKIYLAISLSGLNQKVKDVKKTIAVFVIATIILASLVISLLGKLVLSDPITLLVKGTEKIARGDLNYRVPVKSNDEIGILAISFNKMTDDLKRTTTSIIYLNKEIAERKRAEEEKDRLLRDLNKRVKELNCLYEIARIVEIPNISLEEIFQKTVDVMPPAWQYPNTTCAKIKVKGQEFETSNYKATKWKQSADIKISGKKTGVVELCYLEQKPESDEGPFLKEERNLINAIAERLGKITERKRAEEKLKLFSHSVDSSVDGIAMGDLEGKITYVNETFVRMFGYSREDLIGKEIAFIYAEDQIPKLKEAIKAAVEGGWKGELIGKRKDGELFPMAVSASRVVDHEGKVIAQMASHTDITERKRGEEKLKEAKQEAEEANRLKSEFLANMSHEIRTPMNAIIGMTGIALETDLNDEQREYLSMVKESSYALLGLIDDVLDLSKIEAGRIELESIDFDLRATVESVADTLAPRASVKGLELACLIHHGVPSFLRGDPGRLRQMLVNLGGNAIKFTEKGEVVIGIELEKETEDSATLLFSITDTGVGIPKDTQTRIFESFTQVDGTTTRRYGGTGLGLSISKRLVELLGGQIGVESQPGKGSRFWFTVTFEKQKEFKDVSPSFPPDIRGMRMLVVDDNTTNRTILVKMLESFGCSAEAVESGSTALQALKKAARKEKLFDLVLLDMQMPEMDGEETLRTIKDDPEIKQVLVVILTSIGERGDAARLEALGCAGYLTKPIKQSQLFDTIITVLSRQKTAVERKSGRIVTRHTIAEQKRRRIRILLAEDNPMNQKLAVALLKKAGFSVDAVENGRMVIEALDRTTYNLILMDVQMPKMDGFEATKAIRERKDEKKHTPIVAMTAHAMKGDRERCLNSGMDDYISKPIEPQELFDAIEKWTKSYDPRKGITGQDKSEKDDKFKNDPIDLETALSRFDNNKDFFKEMLEEFLDYAPKQLHTLDEAINKGETKVVEREAHSLKGAAGNLSAKRIADLALKLELLGRTGDLAGAKEMIGNLKTEFKRLEEYIQRSLPQEVAQKS